MATRMQQRRDTAANWTSNNPTLASGEVGFETDTGKFKIGDGATAWTALGYATINPFLTSSTVTAGGTTTLTVASNRQQLFTGTSNQACVLPVVSTLTIGTSFKIINSSTGVITVQSSGSNTILVVPAGATVEFICVLITGTTAASWTSSLSINLYQDVNSILASQVFS